MLLAHLTLSTNIMSKNIYFEMAINWILVFILKRRKKIKITVMSSAHKCVFFSYGITCNCFDMIQYGIFNLNIFNSRHKESQNFKETWLIAFSLKHYLPPEAWKTLKYYLMSSSSCMGEVCVCAHVCVYECASACEPHIRVRIETKVCLTSKLSYFPL
jgi:hypothetical protein